MQKANTSQYLEDEVYPFIDFGTHAGVISAYTKKNTEEENYEDMDNLSDDIKRNGYKFASVNGFYKKDELADKEDIIRGLLKKKKALPEIAYFVYPLEQAKLKNLLGMDDYSKKMIVFWEFLQKMVIKYNQYSASFIRNHYMYYLDDNYASPNDKQVRKYLNTNVIKNGKNSRTLWGKAAGRVIKNKGTLKELKAIVDKHFEENGFTCALDGLLDEMCFGTRDMMTKMDKFKMFLGASVNNKELEAEISEELSRYMRK